MKEWRFKKGSYDCALIIDDCGEVSVSIDSDKVSCSDLFDNKVRFSKVISLKRENKKESCGGFTLDPKIFDEAARYRREIFAKIENAKRIAYETEYNAIMSGEKPLEIEYKEFEREDSYLISADAIVERGYYAKGISGKIIKELGCGRDEGWKGVKLYKEFEKATIHEMKKAHEERIAERKAIEMSKPAEQTFTASKGLSVGDIITKNYCKYKIIKARQDIDYDDIYTYKCIRIED
ncbi:hypothetical protein [Longibaculum muris]|uniref:hypothetical protein n=1 Tax=Longibaculum muris TaxID=1796628 RepID=UPI003AB14F5A